MGKAFRFKADIGWADDGRDKIISVCECGPTGEILREVIIQRGPKEYDVFDDAPGPRVSSKHFGLDLVPGPQKITFSGDVMTLAVSEKMTIEVDLSGLEDDEKEDIRIVAGKIYE